MQNLQDFSGIRVYDGKDPYIFVSYAHKDFHLVIPAIQALQQRGYRVWFDMGIEAGTEWSNNIAAHLRDCSAFLFFVSGNSAASENCLDEVAFAKSHKKPSLMIFLEDGVILPEGTEMQTARFQRMFRSRHSTFDSFVDKLCEAPILEPCQSAPAIVPPAAPIVPPAAPTEPIAPPPVYAAPPAKAKGPGKKLLIPVIVCVLGLIAVLLALLSGMSSSQNDTPSPSTTATPMSNNLMDFTFRLDGKVYQLPFAYRELKDDGWTILNVNFTEETLLPEGNQQITLLKADRQISVWICNTDAAAKPLADCTVGGITLDTKAPEFLLPGDVSHFNHGLNYLTMLYGKSASLYQYEDSFTVTFYAEESQSSPAHHYVKFCIYTNEKDSPYSFVTLQNFP